MPRKLSELAFNALPQSLKPALALRYPNVVTRLPGTEAQPYLTENMFQRRNLHPPKRPVAHRKSKAERDAEFDAIMAMPIRNPEAVGRKRLETSAQILDRYGPQRRDKFEDQTGLGKFKVDKSAKIRKIRNQPLYEVKLYVRTLKEARATVKMHSMTGGMMQEEPAEGQPDEDDEAIGYQQATIDEAIAQTPADQATEDIQTPLPAIQAEDEPVIAEFFDVLLREYPPGSVANRRQAYFEITGVFGRELPQIIANTFYDLWG